MEKILIAEDEPNANAETRRFGVLDFMRENGFPERVPVIALTVFNEEENHLKCCRAGVIDLVMKPCNKEILLRKVRKIVGIEGAILIR